VYKARDMNFTGVDKLVAVKEMINLAPDPTLRAMEAYILAQREGKAIEPGKH